jgi:hypothetical protein
VNLDREAAGGFETASGKQGEQEQAGQKQADGYALGGIEEKPGLAFIAAQIFQQEADGGIKNEVEGEDRAVLRRRG